MPWEQHVLTYYLKLHFGAFEINAVMSRNDREGLAEFSLMYNKREYVSTCFESSIMTSTMSARNWNQCLLGEDPNYLTGLLHRLI